MRFSRHIYCISHPRDISSLVYFFRNDASDLIQRYYRVPVNNKESVTNEATNAFSFTLHIFTRFCTFLRLTDTYFFSLTTITRARLSYSTSGGQSSLNGISRFITYLEIATFQNTTF